MGLRAPARPRATHGRRGPGLPRDAARDARDAARHRARCSPCRWSLRRATDRLARLPATFWDRIAVAREHLQRPVLSRPRPRADDRAGRRRRRRRAGMGVAAKVALVVRVHRRRHRRVRRERPARQRSARASGRQHQAAPRRTPPHTRPRRSTPPHRHLARPPRLTRRSARSRGDRRHLRAADRGRRPHRPRLPRPAGSTEFGPGAIGSTSAPTQPAAAPSGGGGEFLP